MNSINNEEKIYKIDNKINLDKSEISKNNTISNNNIIDLKSNEEKELIFQEEEEQNNVFLF